MILTPNPPSLSNRAGSLAQRQPLLLLAIATVVGVLIDSAIGAAVISGAKFVSPNFHAGFWLPIVAVCAVMIAVQRSIQSRAPVNATVVMMMAFGGLDHHLQTRHYNGSGLLALLNQGSRPTVLEGVVDQPTVLRRHPLAEQRDRTHQSPWQSQIELSVSRIRIGDDYQRVAGRVLVTVDGRRDELLPGDQIRVYGTMRGPGSSTNPGGFDRREYYRHDRIHGRIEVTQADQIETIGPPKSGYMFSRLIATIAAEGRDGLLRELGESSGPLAVALVIGQRDFVDNETRDQLLVTGTAHLLSVSGMHLAIVVAMTTWIAVMLRLSMSMKIVLVLSVCLFYCAITGARPPVIRAAVLVSTLMFALWMRRPGQAINTLSLAALILVILNPENVYSVGVQLSFLAVATLILASARGKSGSAVVDEAIRHEEHLSALVETSRSLPVIVLRYLFGIVCKLFWFSACVSMMSMPLVWHQFHVVSWISIPVNVMLGPLLFLSLALGIVTVACAIVYQPLAVVPAFVCDGSLSAMRWVIESAACVPYGHAWLPSPPTWWVLIFYAVVVSTLLMRPGARTRLVRFGWIAVWMLVAMVMSTRGTPLDEGSLEATFIDVGHGTSVIVRTGDDHVWLYDCGRLGNDTGSSRDIDQGLWSLGVTRLNGVFLSHADSDHFNALPGLLRRFRVDRIYTPPGMLNEPESALDPIREAIAVHRVPVEELSVGDTIDAATMTFSVLHPPAERLPASDNANSLVLMVGRGRKTLLLPGDLEPPGTESLIRLDRPPPGGTLMAPHHGSLQMDAASVLQWFRPAETIVSGGQRAERPEVSEMLSSSGSGVHVTARDGAVRATIDADGKVRIRTWLVSPW